MTKHESQPAYEDNTHRDLYNRLNDTEKQLARLMGGVGVLSILLLVFGVTIWTSIADQGKIGNSNGRTLARIEQMLESIMKIRDEDRTRLKEHITDCLTRTK